VVEVKDLQPPSAPRYNDPAITHVRGNGYRMSEKLGARSIRSSRCDPDTEG
jgi:hypothetical protein